jgi:hypothetical protein
MAPPKKYRRPRPLNDTIMHEWELDLPIFKEKAKAGVTDETTRDAIDATADYLLQVIGEVRRIKAKMASIASDNAVMRRELMDRKLSIRGLCLYEKKGLFK